MVLISFHPGNPRFRRGISILSTYLCTIAFSYSLLIADFGNHEHCFQPVRRYVYPKIDKFFRVTEEDIDNYDSSKNWFNRKY